MPEYPGPPPPTPPLVGGDCGAEVMGEAGGYWVITKAASRLAGGEEGAEGGQRDGVHGGREGKPSAGWSWRGNDQHDSSLSQLISVTASVCALLRVCVYLCAHACVRPCLETAVERLGGVEVWWQARWKGQGQGILTPEKQGTGGGDTGL